MKLPHLFSIHKPNKNIISILDIGSSKIICLIAKLNHNNEINIIGHGCHNSNGFKNGNINDSKAAKLSIIAAIDQAEKMAGVTVESVILALNGNKIKSHYMTPIMNLRKNKVHDRDIDNLILQGVKELEKNGYEVIHYFPIEYSIDNNKGISEPSGLLGNVLSAKIHYVTMPSSALENLINCLASCQLDIEDCIFAPYAAGLSSLTENEQEIGTTIIDFGAGITSYAIFSKKNMTHCGFIPIGSKVITDDIAKSFEIDNATAERIKNINGAANVSYADNNAIISYKVGDHFDHEDKQISNIELNDVINARLEEILNLLKNTLTKHNIGYPNIVLTGGGSLLTGITDEVNKIFRNKSRLGKPVTFEGLNHNLVNATYAAALGVLQYISNNTAEDNHSLNHPSIYTKIFNWLKENF
jgi:cell division protein FtsA